MAAGAATWAVLALASWLLAEFFTRRRRMAFPSIVLLCLYALSAFKVADHLLALTAHEAAKKSFNALLGIASPSMGLVAIAALAASAMVALHYLRFRVPITIAAVAAALVMAVITGLLSAFDIPEWVLRVLDGAMGLAIFALAMRFDLSDPERETRRTDIAFWLHMLAAPLVANTLIGGIAAMSAPSGTHAVAILALFVLLGVVAVIIDRRAILVSGLSYAGFAFYILVHDAGFEGKILPLTLLVLGAFVLLLSAGWRPVRTALLRLLPAHLAQRLPHPILSSS
ncbi:hypothetical protein [Microvirga terricola]|uniref:hypothetical protein n=1 Tax=Microvirga terricola TaxID=2719797 RepID=UPI001FEFC17C|nr:hypothetical protein [Microvirga terricola]